MWDSISAVATFAALKDSLALRAVAVHAVLDGLVADLPDGAARHVHSQARLRAPLDAPPQPAALGVHYRVTRPQRETEKERKGE